MGGLPPIFFLLAALLALAPVALAADAKSGRAKAAACALCHGKHGISTVPDAPHLAGQPALYVEEQLRSYRSGARRHEVMNIVARTLSDADIADLAAWFASITVEATSPSDESGPAR
jgi:cytochrome c553